MDVVMLAIVYNFLQETGHIELSLSVFAALTSFAAITKIPLAPLLDAPPQPIDKLHEQQSETTTIPIATQQLTVFLSATNPPTYQSTTTETPTTIEDQSSAQFCFSIPDSPPLFSDPLSPLFLETIDD